MSGCSKDKEETTPSASPPPSSPLPPVYDPEKIKSSLFRANDLGSKWKEDVVIDAFKEGELRGCSDSRIELPGDPHTNTNKFGAPESRTTGANYAYFSAVYPGATEAADVMKKIRERLSKCPEKDEIPFKQLPKKRFIYQHDNTWKLTEGEISGWNHIRGFEKSVYPPSVSIINVIHFSIDYAQRGNVLFSSIYWQRTKPKASSEPIAEKATDLLTEQLKNFG